MCIRVNVWTHPGVPFIRVLRSSGWLDLLHPGLVCGFASGYLKMRSIKVHIRVVEGISMHPGISMPPGVKFVHPGASVRVFRMCPNDCVRARASGLIRCIQV